MEKCLTYWETEDLSPEVHIFVVCVFVQKKGYSWLRLMLWYASHDKRHMIIMRKGFWLTEHLTASQTVLHIR